MSTAKPPLTVVSIKQYDAARLSFLERLLAEDGASQQLCRAGIAALVRALGDFIEDASKDESVPRTAKIRAEIEAAASAAAAAASALRDMSQEARRYVRLYTPEHCLGDAAALDRQAAVLRHASSGYVAKSGPPSDPHAFRLLCRGAVIWRACRNNWPPLTRATATTSGSNRPEGAVVSALLDAMREEVDRLAPSLLVALKDGTYCTAVKNRRAAFSALIEGRLLSESEAAALIDGDFGDPNRRPRDVLIQVDPDGNFRAREQEPSFKSS